MPTIVGVRLGPSGKVLTFDAAGTSPELGDTVIVSTERGEEIGEIATGLEDIEPEQVERKLKPVLRVATARDMQIADDLKQREVEAMARYRELVGEHGLDMKPVAVEALFDERKMVFYFTAEERVDFRALVKDLARDFKTRVDMRQIGVRDEARMLGGIGHCGQQLCCRRYMDDFEPVSIRMAKAQDLPLNPLKISGLCGRLMCCLRYEYEAYKDYKSRAPKMGASIETPDGAVKVISLDAPRETVTLGTPDGRVTVPLEHMECEGCPGPRPCRVSAEALDEARGRNKPALLGIDEGTPPISVGKSDSGGKGSGRGSSKGGGGGGSRSGSRKKRSGRSRRGGQSRSKSQSGSGGGGQQGKGGGQQGKGGQQKKGQGGQSGGGRKKQGQSSGGQKRGGQSGGGAKKKQSQGGQSRGQSGTQRGQEGQATPGRRRRRRRPRDGGGSQTPSDG